MKFKNEEEKHKFLNDKKYYNNSDNYCLGNTLEEAGQVIRIIIQEHDAELASSEKAVKST